MNEQNVEVIQKTSQEETIIRKEIKKKIRLLIIQQLLYLRVHFACNENIIFAVFLFV
jgi:hypothetical protein